MTSTRTRVTSLIVAAVIAAAAGAYALRPDPTTGPRPSGAPPPRPEVVDLVEEHLRAQDAKAATAEVANAEEPLHPSWEAYAKGLILISEGRHAEARPLLETAYETLPDDPRVMDALRSTLTDSPDDQKLQGQLVEGFLRANPNDERALLAVALHVLRLPMADRDPDRAWALMRQIRDQRAEDGPPDDSPREHEISLLWVQAEADSQTGRHQEALELAKTLSKLVPKNAEVWAFCGEVARRAGRWRYSLQAYETAVTLAPDERRYLEHLIQLALEKTSPAPQFQVSLLGRTAELVERWPTEKSAHVLRARALVRATDAEPEGYDKARLIYEKLLEKYPDDLEILRNLGVLLYDWKQGGLPGDYLDDAHRVLSDYERYGGTFEGQLLDVWTRLKARVVNAPK